MFCGSTYQLLFDNPDGEENTTKMIQKTKKEITLFKGNMGEKALYMPLAQAMESEKPIDY